MFCRNSRHLTEYLNRENRNRKPICPGQYHNNPLHSLTTPGTRRTPASEIKSPAPNTKNGIRVFLQNPNRVMKKDRLLDNRRALVALRECEVDIIALPKTNKKWQLKWVKNKWTNKVKQVRRYAKVFTASLDALHNGTMNFSKEESASSSPTSGQAE